MTDDEMMRADDEMMRVFQEVTLDDIIAARRTMTHLSARQRAAVEAREVIIGVILALEDADAERVSGGRDERVVG